MKYDGMSDMPCLITRAMSRISRDAMEALWKGDAVALAERLEEGGVVDWGARRDGCLPLHLAVFRGHTAVAALLLGVGADVNRADDYVFGAMTPLHEAACYGRADIVPLLVKANADVNQPDRGGWLPLHYAVMYECQPGRPGHLRLNVAAQLLAAGSDVNQASNIGLTPLAAAARHGCFGAVQILCSYGAARNGTEIEQATVNRHPKVAAWLTATADCITPLHYPSIIPPERACRLLRAGADLRAARSHGGHTPLSIACELSARGVAPTGSTARLIIVHHRIRQWLSIARLASFLRRVCVRAAERRRKRQRHEL